LGVLFLAIADMVIKPRGDDAAVLVAGAAILARAAVVGGAAIRRRRHAEPRARAAKV
jgi:hypothetical protein